MLNRLLGCTLLFALVVPTAFASSLATGDSCDVTQFPAATLLLPEFDVDFLSPATIAPTTLVTVVNASKQPQIAAVTLWTDLGYPVVTFPVYLTGYDAQTINLYDVFARGLIASTSSATTPGARSAAANPNFLATAGTSCASLGGTLPASLLTDLRTAFTVGILPATCGSVRVGMIHVNAIGYATVDVVATCALPQAGTPAYFDTLLYDNVLTGDYQRITPNPATGNYASATPLVHIRAVPAGGAAGNVQATNLPYTFYDRYTPRTARTMDRRQPLPSAFAARFINGGTGSFQTAFTIWREGKTGIDTACAGYAQNNAASAALLMFDERENPFVLFQQIEPPSPPPNFQFPLAGSIRSDNGALPFMTSGDVAGWMYFNLNNGGSSAYSAARSLAGGSTTTGVRPSQAYVSTTMFAEGRYSVEQSATPLGNGCSPSPIGNFLGGNNDTIHPGPLPNVNP